MDYDLSILLYSGTRLPRVAAIARTVQQLVQPRRVLLVLNGPALDEAAVRRAFACHAPIAVLRHDNTGLEFGGYQRAIDSMRDDMPPRLVIMNDTVGSHDKPTRAYLGAFMQTIARPEEKLVVGTVELTERSMALRGLRSSRWIRSHLFGMDHAALRAAEYRMYHPDVDDLITASPDMDEFFGASVTGTLRDHLSAWLFSSTGNRWYGAEPLRADNCARMAAKARAILQEKYLSLVWDAASVSFRQPYLDRRARMSHSVEKGLRLLAERLGSQP